METKKIVMGVISVAVAIIVLMSMIPIFTDAGASEDTFSNVGYYDMVYSEAEELTFEWDHTNPYQVTIDGEIVTLPQSDFTAKTILCGDSWVLRYAYEGTLKTFVQFYGSIGSQVVASVSAETDMTVTCSNGSVSVANTAATPDTFSTTYTHLYVVSDDGNLVMKDANTPAYLNGDSEIVAVGLSKVGTTPSCGISITGTIDDGFTWEVFRGSGITFTDEAADYSEVSGYLDLYSLSKFTATATNSTGSSNLTYSYFIVPAEVTAERSAHASPVESTLIGLIPLLMMVGIMLTAVGLFIAKYRKN